MRNWNPFRRVPLNVERGMSFRWKIPETGKLSAFSYQVQRLRIIDGILIVDGAAICGAGLVHVSRPIDQIHLEVEEEDDAPKKLDVA